MIYHRLAYLFWKAKANLLIVLIRIKKLGIEDRNENN